MGAEPRFVLLVGLQVDDASAYAEYRKHMRPILLRYGGDFEYDFLVSEVLRQPEPRPINRLFSIAFPSEQASDAFFSDPEYLAVRERHFVSAVSSVTQLARFQRL